MMAFASDFESSKFELFSFSSCSIFQHFLGIKYEINQYEPRFSPELEKTSHCFAFVRTFRVSMKMKPILG